MTNEVLGNNVSEKLLQEVFPGTESVVMFAGPSDEGVGSIQDLNENLKSIAGDGQTVVADPDEPNNGAYYWYRYGKLDGMLFLECGIGCAGAFAAIPDLFTLPEDAGKWVRLFSKIEDITTYPE